MRVDRIADALHELDAEQRALLELSLAKGLPDEDLASLLGVDTDGIAQRREQALEVVGATSQRAREALIEALGGRRSDGGAAADPGQPEPVPAAVVEPLATSDVEAAALDGPAELDGPGLAEPAEQPEQAQAPAADAPFDPAELAEPPPPIEPLWDPPADHLPPPDPFTEPTPAQARSRRSRRGPLWLAAIAGVAVAVAVALALSGGGPDDGGAGKPGRAAARPLPDLGRPGPGSLRPLVGGRGAGRAEIDGRTLRVSVRRLPRPDGEYVVWLYDSVSDARPLLAARAGSFDRRVELPRGADRYRFLDVSTERRDGNPNHGGASVLRTRLRSIPRR